MTVLSRLLTPSAAEKPIADRIAELDSQSAEFVAGIAVSDGDEKLRCAAIVKLPFGDALLSLAGLEGNKDVTSPIQLAARKRLAALIDTRGSDLDLLMSRNADWSAVLAVAALCSDASNVQRVIARIESSETLFDLATSAPSSRVRQAASEAIEDPALLRRVLKNVRGSDKNVYKIVKAKLDALLAQEKAAAETQAHIESLCAALERHSHLPFDNLFAPTLEYLQKQWTAVAAEAADVAITRAQAALERCHATATKHVQEVATQAAHEAAVANADAARRALLEELQTLLAKTYEGADTPALQGLANRWSDLAQYKAPDKSESDRYRSLRDAVNAVASSLREHGELAAQAAHFRNAQADAEDLNAREKTLRKILSYRSLLGDETPAVVMDAEAALEAWRKERQEKENAHAHALRQLGGLIHKASGALRAGQSRHASGIRRSLDEKLQTFGPLPEALNKQLHALDEKLKELKDWKSYAVAPKRIELIESMEALIGSKVAPNELAEQIKRLQDEWKSISKGATDNADEEWQRFHNAAQAAFAPCREYFAAQAKQREANLEKRKALLARLTAFEQQHDWERPDWREVARALRESRQQWRNHQPVERAPNKPVQSAFDAVSGKMQALLDVEYARNLEERKALIAQAERLVTSDDTRQAIEDAKRLQLAWKNAGVAPREEDQALWAEFRKHCDAIFAKRDREHSEYAAGLESNKTKAIALCEELEGLLSHSGTELTEAAKKIGPLRQSFNEIGELPRAVSRELTQRFDRGIDKLDKAIGRQRALEKAHSWTTLLEAGDKVRRYRIAAALGAGPEELAALRQTAQMYVDAVQQWPKGGHQAIKAELNKERSNDVAANETALRTLCVRAEILSDTPSPPTDQVFRRNYQLQLLKQSIGEGIGKAQSAKDELDALVFEWIAVGATTDATYSELTKRFESCRAKAAGR